MLRHQHNNRVVSLDHGNDRLHDGEAYKKVLQKPARLDMQYNRMVCMLMSPTL